MQDILSLISGGLIGGFLGAFLGGFAKFFWDNWLPGQLTWRREQKVERDKLLSQFRAPAIRAVSELQGRVYSILKGNNYAYLKSIKNEEYFVTSTAFLLAALFAWVEILRQKVGALDYAELTLKLSEVTHSFARGERGFQIFHLEQREIGERMLMSSAGPDQLSVGYASFVEILKSKQAPACFLQLSRKVEYLLENPAREAIRLVTVQHALVDLIDFIDPHSRWVLEKERKKIDMREHLKELLDKKKVTIQKYETLESAAREAGLLID
jgi:hypothetical protein